MSKTKTQLNATVNATAERCSCGSGSAVYDTRAKEVMTVRKRRCLSCERKWSTAEVRITSKGYGIEDALIRALVIAKLETLVRRMRSPRERE